MPLLEAETLGRAASASIHLMGLTHGFSLYPDWEGSTLAQTGREKSWEKIFEWHLGIPRRIRKAGKDFATRWDGTGGGKRSGAQAWSLNSFGNFLPCLKSVPWLGILELFNRNNPRNSPR